MFKKEILISSERCFTFNNLSAINLFKPHVNKTCLVKKPINCNEFNEMLQKGFEGDDLDNNNYNRIVVANFIHFFILINKQFYRLYV